MTALLAHRPTPQRILLVVAALACVVVLIMPLSATDWAQGAHLPLLADRLWFRVATTIAMFIVMASAWNIIGGLAGYAAFGNVAFFGIGAYASGVAVVKGHVPLPVALVLAPCTAGAFAAVIGVPLLRLRGHYFAIATLGISVALGEVVDNLDALGGSTGLFLPIVRSDLLFFYLMSGAAALAVGVTWWVTRSRFGYGLLAIRESEEAAAVIGVSTTLHKVGAFVLAGALTGLAGGIFAQWNVFINPENTFPVDYNVQMILMAVFGGAGTVLGPVAGAIVIEVLIQRLAVGGAAAIYAQIGLGFLLAATVVFIPRGVIDFIGGRSRLTLSYLRRSLQQTSV
ncbi:MAG: branched-chain amino acid ABC transporter permease [Candidatus Dormibacteria bacterium]